MNLNLRFDPSVNATEQAAVNVVKAYFESFKFTDNITINITVAFGAISGLGRSSVSLNSFTYAKSEMH